MSDVAERIRQLVGGKPIASFARECGILESSLRGYIEGKSLPSLQNLAAIHRATGVSIDWIVTGEGPNVPSDPAVGDAESAEMYVRIPKLCVRASAGHGGAVVEDSSEGVLFPRFVIDRLQLRPDQVRLMEASGVSMEPTIGDHDLMLVDVTPATQTSPSDGRIYVFSVGDDVFVKRLLRSAAGWVMRSDNRELYPVDEPIPAGVPLFIFGRVRWAGRRL